MSLIKSLAIRNIIDPVMSELFCYDSDDHGQTIKDGYHWMLTFFRGETVIDTIEGRNGEDPWRYKEFKSIIAKLQNKFHVSAAEIDEQDTHQIIVIGVAFIVPYNALADSIMDEISVFVEENTEAEILDEMREMR